MARGDKALKSMNRASIPHRWRSYITGATYVGTTLTLQSTNSPDVTVTISGGGGSTTPGGADQNIQYNNGDEFGGIAAFGFDDTNIILGATTKLYFDGSGGPPIAIGDTYLVESSADVLDIYVGAANMMKFTEAGTDVIDITANTNITGATTMSSTLGTAGLITASGGLTMHTSQVFTMGGNGVDDILKAADSASDQDDELVTAGYIDARYAPVAITGTVTSVAIGGNDGIDVDSGSPITTAGTIQLGLSSIPNSSLANNSVNYGGVTVALGASDTTPAFDLADATNYPGTSALVTVGTITAGTWQGTEVGLGYGGTELVGETDGKIVIADGAGAPTHLDVGSSTGITILGTIATGVWNGTAVDGAYVDIEGTEIKSTGPEADTKFLRADGDGTCSWQVPGGGGTVTGGGANNYLAHWTSATNITGTSGLQYDDTDLTITSSTTTKPIFLIENTTNDSKSGRIEFYNNRSSGYADDDLAGKIRFTADNDAAEKITFGEIYFLAADVTDATEDGSFFVSLASGGSANVQAFGIEGGVITTGTWNATAITNSYLANSSVSYGGIAVALGASDATPAFDLADATNYPGDEITATSITDGYVFNC